VLFYELYNNKGHIHLRTASIFGRFFPPTGFFLDNDSQDRREEINSQEIGNKSEGHPDISRGKN